jgi:hypothetical protein
MPATEVVQESLCDGGSNYPQYRGSTNARFGISNTDVLERGSSISAVRAECGPSSGDSGAITGKFT